MACNAQRFWEMKLFIETGVMRNTPLAWPDFQDTYVIPIANN